MSYKEIILKLLKAIEDTLEYENPNYGDKHYGEFGHGRLFSTDSRERYYRIFPYNPEYKFLKDIPKGELSPIFDMLKKEKVLEVTNWPIPREELDKLDEETIETEGEIYCINPDLYNDLTSFHFKKLENFYPYLRSLRNEMSGKLDKYLIKKDELSFDKKNGILFFKDKECIIPQATIQYYIVKCIFSKQIGEKIPEDDILEEFDSEKERKRTIYDACRALNKKIEENFGLKNLFIKKAALVYLNDKYFS